jgi:uncharacterized protein (TIGR03085 family)
MGATDLLVVERAALCDTFDAVGPDAPTLDEGWVTSDLAAHLLVRETRPDAAVGILLPGPFTRHMTNVMEHVKRRGYEAMVAALRKGPPLVFRAGPMAAPNVVENWIHHEDVRRARGDGPRPSQPELDDLFWRSLGLSARMAARRVRSTGLELRTPDGKSRVVSDKPGADPEGRTDVVGRRRLWPIEHRRSQPHERGPRVTLTGEPGELVLFLSGRKEPAVVELGGPPDAVALVNAARFGV